MEPIGKGKMLDLRERELEVVEILPPHDVAERPHRLPGQFAAGIGGAVRELNAVGSERRWVGEGVEYSDIVHKVGASEIYEHRALRIPRIRNRQLVGIVTPVGRPEHDLAEEVPIYHGRPLVDILPGGHPAAPLQYARADVVADGPDLDLGQPGYFAAVVNYWPLPLRARQSFPILFPIQQPHLPRCLSSEVVYLSLLVGWQTIVFGLGNLPCPAEVAVRDPHPDVLDDVAGEVAPCIGPLRR